jgi:hypothetical protein
MSARARRLLSALAFGGLVACGSTNDPGSRITSLRVILVQANQTGDAVGGDYAHPGETVNLSAVFYDPARPQPGPCGADASTGDASMGDGSVGDGSAAGGGLDGGATDAGATDGGPVIEANWLWLYCVDPASDSVVGCIAKFAQDSLATLGADASVASGGGGASSSADGSFALPASPNATTFSLTVPDDAISRLPTAAQPSAVIGVLPLTCPGTLFAHPSANALEGQLPISCEVVGSDGTRTALPLDQWSIGIKRIFVRQKDRNANPIITGLTFDGADWPAACTASGAVPSVGTCDSTTNTYSECSGSDHHSIGVQIDPSSFESGTDEYGQTYKEEVVVQLYASEGIFEHDVLLGSATAPSTTNYVVRSAALAENGGLVHLWVVVRDNRGGVSWTERWVQAH